MKKRNYLLLILFILFLSIQTPSIAQQRQSPPLEVQKISESLFQLIGGGGANGGFYIGDNGVLVIDSKMSKEGVDSVITEIGKITDKPILYLVNTHSDGDHISGNRYFAPSVTIVAHENCRQEFFHPQRNGNPSAWAESPELAPFIPSITFSDKMEIHLGNKKVELWYFGVGHTTGDTVVYFPEEKTAFLGDQIFMGRPQLIHSYKGGNSFEHVKTLSKMMETLNAETFCSGHAELLNRGEIEHHIEEMKILQNKIKSLVEQGKSLDEIKAEFPENHARLVESIVNEIKN